MAFTSKTVALLLIIATLLVSLSKVSTAISHLHMVGDDAGWIIHNNYVKWTSSNNFQVGDTLVFDYNKDYHNVMQVSRQDFKSCNISSPIATYNTGSDFITLTRPGHYYYLCGVPGHCQAGQKVQVVVSELINPSPAPTPIASPTLTPSTTEITPTSSTGSLIDPILFSSLIVVAIILLF